MIITTMKHSGFIMYIVETRVARRLSYAKLRDNIVPHDMLSFMIDIIVNAAQLMKTIII